MCAAKNNKNRGKQGGLSKPDLSIGGIPIVGDSGSVVDRIAKGVGSVLGGGVLTTKKGIVEDKPFTGTCGVCGSPIHPLMTGIPVDTRTCKVCHQTVCAKHYSRSKQMCSKCATGNDNWCKTPPKL